MPIGSHGNTTERNDVRLSPLLQLGLGEFKSHIGRGRYWASHAVAHVVSEGLGLVGGAWEPREVGEGVGNVSLEPAVSREQAPPTSSLAAI